MLQTKSIPKEIQIQRLYRVLLFNDDHNKFDDAVSVVMRVFRYSPDRSFAVVFVAHVQGVSCAERRLPFEIAEHRRNALRSYGFTATLIIDE